MKKVRVSTLAYLLSFQTICLLLLLSLMFSFSVSNHDNLLISTYDMIIEAKSSNLTRFFLFNVILITILHGSLKPPAAEHETEEKENDELNLEIAEDHYSCSEEREDGDDENHGCDGYDKDNDHDIGAEGEAEDCRDGDLESRIEEFIAKVNKTWREEIRRERLVWTQPS